MAWTDWFSSGSSSGGSSIWGDIFKGVLGGLSATAAGKRKTKDLKFSAEQAIALAMTQGLEGRKTSAFERDLEYYYKRLDNKNKRIALDSYGAFSKLGTFAPSTYVQPAVPTVPTKPVPGA